MATDDWEDAFAEPWSLPDEVEEIKDTIGQFRSELAALREVVDDLKRALWIAVALLLYLAWKSS
jgi:hypothetical protein